jgi:hypothetical protein
MALPTFGENLEDRIKKKYLRRIFESAKVDVRRCWIYGKSRCSNGYGGVSVNGKTRSAHRAVYELMFGTLAADEFVLHQCDNKMCINPFHLAVGCRSQNMKEAYERGIKKPTRKRTK